MIVVTSDSVPGREIVATLGLVRGNTVRSRHLGRMLAASFRALVGGELHEYTKLLAETREQSLDRMIAEARAQGADAIVGVRFATSEISAAAAEFMAYGTAVKLAPERGAR
jgi:uncharacterized protein YbjQ (UPF0145 family)